jgi:exodeoxyribonuclease VII large subunit
VSAELASVDERKGHYYLSLVEKDEEGDTIIARSEAVIWQKSAKSWQRQNKLLLKDLLQAGRQVRLLVQAEFHERYGLKLMASDIDTNYTLGQLAQQRQLTIQKLQSKGLLDTNKMLELKTVPQRLAIISSPAAAGLQDFLQQLTDNPYGYVFSTQFFPAAVQGPQASPEIRRQLRTIARRADDYDAIVIIRGGGSRIDLAEFDDLELCTAAAKAPLPVISGIGHDIDQSVLDMVAHTSLKTPTAVATFLIERLLYFEQHLAGLAQLFRQLQLTYLQEAGSQLLQKEQLLGFLTQKVLQRQQWQLEQSELRLPQLIQQRLKTAKIQLQQLREKQEMLRLETSLNRGFSLVSKKGKIITSKSSLSEEDQLDLDFKDGRQSVTIKKLL